MTLAITAALVSAGVLGFWFSSTRGIAIVATAVLAFVFPWLAVLVLLGSAAAFYLFHIK